MVGWPGRFGLIMAFLLAFASNPAAQHSPQALLAEAERLYQQADGSPSSLVPVKELLDRIVNEYPASDLAVSVLLAQPVGTIDVAALNARLHNTGAAPETVAKEPAKKALPPLHAGRPAATTPLPMTPGTEASEAALALDKQAIRDLQARLLVLGYDPNGIDGAAGRGTRAALRAWQQSQGIEATGYLNEVQRQRLRAESEVALGVWRANPENERLYTPPPPIALGPRNVSGTWRFTTKCGANSALGRTTITGVLNVGHAGGNRYSGRVQQSQGFRGQFSGRLNGRRMSGEINWGLLLGRVQVAGTIADQKLAMSGRDSNRCSFYAVKS